MPGTDQTHFGGAYAGKHVLVTGHTGFKGSWLCEWLLQLGAKVTGIALAPPTMPALFDQLGLGRRLNHFLCDVRDSARTAAIIEEARPDFVFHLAAQPLVRLSYTQPLETYATNVMGTAHVLEALRRADRRCSAVIITTDKCYENREWVHSYREDDPMGGHDPYSSSKGAAELIVAAYRKSFFSAPNSPVRVASARAGNVIGGGDWALDRIVPDCIRALQRNEAVAVRNKVATRPWQHVLEPLSGYLWLAACLSNPRLAPVAVSCPDPMLHEIQIRLGAAFNFGPSLNSNRTVADLVHEILKHWRGSWKDCSDPHAVHEAKLLNLATDKAHHLLGWKPVWTFEETVRRTVEWYKACVDPRLDAAPFTQQQIADYSTAAAEQIISWRHE